MLIYFFYDVNKMNSYYTDDTDFSLDNYENIENIEITNSEKIDKETFSNLFLEHVNCGKIPINKKGKDILDTTFLKVISEEITATNSLEKIIPLVNSCSLLFEKISTIRDEISTIISFTSSEYIPQLVQNYFEQISEAQNIQKILVEKIWNLCHPQNEEKLEID